MAEDPATPLDPRAADFDPAAFPVEFDSAPVGGGPAPFTLNEDGTFELMNMSGRRVLRAQTASPGWMVKRITRQSDDITDLPIDFTKAMSRTLRSPSRDASPLSRDGHR